jgi:hypothetical protein
MCPYIKQSETHLVQGSNNFPKFYGPEGGMKLYTEGLQFCCETVI